MRVEVTFRNFAASKPLQSYATGKVEKLARFMNRAIDGHVVLTKNAFRNVAECTMRDTKGSITASYESEDDMYAAVDGLIDKLDIQARRRKGKRLGHRGKGVSDTVGEMEAIRSKEAAADLDAELDALGE